MNQMTGMGCASFVARASRWRNWVVSTACVALLSACGGGGGSSSSASGPAPIDPSRVVVSTLSTHDAAEQPVVLKFVSAILLDSSTGNWYVYSCFTHQILMIEPDGLVTVVAGSGVSGAVDGDGTSAQFSCATGLAFDASGALYVADTDNNTIRKLVKTGHTGTAADWMVTTFAGSQQAGYRDTDTTVPPTDALFSAPSGLALDTNANVLYVADIRNNVIRKLDLSSPNGAVSTLAGSGQNGTVDGPRRTAQFNGPRRIELDARRGLYVNDFNGLHYVSLIKDEVTTLRTVDGFYTHDTAGNLYADDDNYTLSMITPSGQVSVLVGAAGSGHTDGTGDVAQLHGLGDIAFDEAHKTLYVLEYDIHSMISDIRKIVLP